MIDKRPVKTILVADDAEPDRMLAFAALQSFGYRLLSAADGDEAWAVIQAEQPDLVLMDVMMPGRNGLDVTREIRRTPSLSGVRVIVVTALEEAEWAIKAINAGAINYLSKPFSPRELRRVIADALGDG